MFFQMLEGLHEDEAKVLLGMKNKSLNVKKKHLCHFCHLGDFLLQIVMYISWIKNIFTFYAVLGLIFDLTCSYQQL